MGSLAAFTQLLSMIGAGSGLNIFVWTVGMGAMGGIVGAVTSGLAVYGYDKAYQVSVDSNSTADEITAAEALLLAFKFEWLMTAVMTIAINIELSMVLEAWWSA